MTAGKGRILLGLAASLAAVLLAVLPVHADTATELKAARERLRRVQATLDALATQYAEAQTELAQYEMEVAAARRKIEALEDRMASIAEDIDQRIRGIYVNGGAKTIGLLLSSESIADFSDRAEFLGQVASVDSDLLLEAQRTREETRREEANLKRLRQRQQETVSRLAKQKAEIARQLAEAQSLAARLSAQLERERAAAAAAARAKAVAARAAVGGSGMQVCPVGNPHSFSNDFGAPRPGGRVHQGIDILAPLGTPIYAAHGGTYVDNYNSLGGIGANVRAGDGTFTYYTHMSARAGVGSGSSVSSGTVIGYVGNSGNASGGPFHLHFEYHPGGGAAANPYSMLVAVC